MHSSVSCSIEQNCSVLIKLLLIGASEWNTCTFSRSVGYELQGSNNGTDPICEPLTCSDVAMVADDIITSSYDMTYQSQLYHVM